MFREGDTRITDNMRSILEVVVRANKDGSWVDMDQLIQRVNYHVTKEAIQFTLRNMVKKQLIAKGESTLRRGRKRLVLIPTELGYQIARRKYSHDEISGLRDIISDVSDILE